MSLAKPRGDAAKAFAASEVRHEAEYSSRPSITIRWSFTLRQRSGTADGKLTVYDKTQGVQNVQRYLCSVFGLKPDDIRVLSPFVGGRIRLGAASAISSRYWRCSRPWRSSAPVRLVLTRQQMYGLGYRPATIERLAIGAKADGTLEAMTHEAITMTSQYEAFARNDTTWSGAALQMRQRAICAQTGPARSSDPLRYAGAGRGNWRLCAGMRHGRARRRLKIDPLELRCAAYSERDQNEDVPFTSKALRECYRQGAEAFGWAKRNPEPRSMRDGSELVGWGMATGVWEALQMRTALAHHA